MTLPTKFRFPSEEVFDIVRTRFRLDESPLVQAIAYVGEGREPTGATLEDGSPEYRPTAGFLVDIMWGDGLPDVPDALVPFIVDPEFPRQVFAGREADERAAGSLALPGTLDLATVDPEDLKPSAAELDELLGDPGATRKAQQAARKAARLAVQAARAAVEESKAAAAQIAAANDRIATADAVRDEALAAIAAANAVIDSDTATKREKEAAREAKKTADAVRDEALAVIAAAKATNDTNQPVRALLQGRRDALRAEIDTLKAQRS